MRNQAALYARWRTGRSLEWSTDELTDYDYFSKLRPVERRLVADCLQAYTTYDDLANAVYYQTGMNPSTIMHEGKTVPTAVRNLMVWAESSDRLGDLIQIALLKNPRNGNLHSLAHRFPPDDRSNDGRPPLYPATELLHSYYQSPWAEIQSIIRSGGLLAHGEYILLALGGVLLTLGLFLPVRPQAISIGLVLLGAGILAFIAKPGRKESGNVLFAAALALVTVTVALSIAISFVIAQVVELLK